MPSFNSHTLSILALLLVVALGASAELHVYQPGEVAPAFGNLLQSTAGSVAQRAIPERELSGELARRLTAGEMVSYAGYYRLSDVGTPVFSTGGTLDDCVSSCANDPACVFADYYITGAQCVHDTTYPSTSDIAARSDLALAYKTGIANGGCDPSTQITNFDGSCTTCGAGTVPSADDKTCVASGPSARARSRARAAQVLKRCGDYGVECF